MVEPRVVTGAKTPPDKLRKMREAIALSERSKAQKRNRRVVAKEEARLRSKRTRAQAIPSPVKPDGELTGEALSERNEALRSWIRANKYWLDELDAEAFDALLVEYWRSAKGQTTWKAFLASAANARIEAIGLPLPSDVQREQHADRIRRIERLSDWPPSGGW
jgi:hypothetical protein